MLSADRTTGCTSLSPCGPFPHDLYGSCTYIIHAMIINAICVFVHMFSGCSASGGSCLLKHSTFGVSYTHLESTNTAFDPLFSELCATACILVFVLCIS